MATENEERVHYRACNLCEAICGLEIRTRGDDILSIRGDVDDPFSRGHICPKAVALIDLQNDPDRLRKPVKRVGDAWEEISWDAAFDFAAERLAEICNTHGPDAIAMYLGNPSVHNYGNLTHAQRFLGQIRTRNRYSATSVDQLPHQLIAYWMYGHQLLVPIPDIDRTDLFLVLGANPMASNGSLMTVPDFRGRLRELQGRGGKMIVLDPRRTETAQVADEHYFIRPGTDAAFLLALLKMLFKQGRPPAHLAEMSDGLDQVAAALDAFDLETLASYCGVELTVIRHIADAFSQAGSAVCYGRMGLSTQSHGSLCQWLIQLINLVSGNLDREGGAMFTLPAVDLVGGPTSKPGHYGKWRSRVRNLPEFGGELPVAALSEEMETEGEGQVRALVTIAGNPVLSTPGGPRLERALAGLGFMLSIDMYLNETTRHADLILPPTTTLEHDHYDLVFHVLAVRNTARYSEPMFAKPDDARHDWEIFEALGARLAEKLGKKHSGFPRPDQIVDMGLQSGPYGAMRGHSAKLSLAALKQAPHGIDLGPMKSCLPERLAHADHRIRCAPPELLKALEDFHAGLTEPPVQGLRLIGRRHLRSNNSWMHNAPRLVKGPRRDRLWMHPDDLASRGLVEGQRVRLSSGVGGVEVEVEGNDDVMPGVVCLPHGWGHGRKGVRMEVARAHAGVSYNDVADPAVIDPVSGNAALNGQVVTVEAL